MNEIWSEDENSIREINNMLNSDGKTCNNCHWGNNLKVSDTMLVTCGHL